LVEKFIAEGDIAAEKEEQDSISEMEVNDIISELSLSQEEEMLNTLKEKYDETITVDECINMLLEFKSKLCTNENLDKIKDFIDKSID